MGKSDEVRESFDQNEYLSVGFFSSMGDRSDQQDNYGYHMDPTGGIFTVCDGMGGHRGGEKASDVACRILVSEYQNAHPGERVSHRLIESAKRADTAVAALTDAEGMCLNAGTTTVTVAIRDKILYWLSVGDSRIYLKRGKEFIQITFDHIYGTVLKEQLEAGEITPEEFESEAGKSESLISYLGLGALDLIDYSDEGLALQSGDMVIMMTDGLYKVVADNEINAQLDSFSDTAELLRMLEARAKRNSILKQKKRDNMTVAVIKIL